MQIVSVVDRSARSWVSVALSGAIDGPTAVAILRSALGALLRARPKGMSLDLGGVGELSPAGLAELRRHVLAAADAGTWVELVNAPLPVHRQLAQDPILEPVLEAYAWRRPGERARITAQRSGPAPVVRSAS